jgi:hypothetical protein
MALAWVKSQFTLYCNDYRERAGSGNSSGSRKDVRSHIIALLNTAPFVLEEAVPGNLQLVSRKLHGRRKDPETVTSSTSEAIMLAMAVTSRGVYW